MIICQECPEKLNNTKLTTSGSRPALATVSQVTNILDFWINACLPLRRISSLNAHVVTIQRKTCSTTTVYFYFGNNVCLHAILNFYGKFRNIVLSKDSFLCKNRKYFGKYRTGESGNRSKCSTQQDVIVALVRHNCVTKFSCLLGFFSYKV